VLYSKTLIGSNCAIHSGAIIGADGFGFAQITDGTFKKILGNVIMEDNVDIGSCATIDGATMGSTIIRKGVKLDNQIQIAHNVEIGENTVILKTGTGSKNRQKRDDWRTGRNCRAFNHRK
jgi:UDP-3-O-[3-hydroxymyristoyl] glucosamine N-acyltransferase